MNSRALGVRGADGRRASQVWNATRHQRESKNGGNEMTGNHHNATHDTIDISKGQEFTTFAGCSSSILMEIRLSISLYRHYGVV